MCAVNEEKIELCLVSLIIYFVPLVAYIILFELSNHAN